MDDVVYIPKLVHNKSGGFMFLGSISREILSTTCYYETAKRAATVAERFIGEFVASYNKDKADFEGGEVKELVSVTDYSFEIIPFPRKEMMLLKLQGKKK